MSAPRRLLSNVVSPSARRSRSFLAGSGRPATASVTQTKPAALTTLQEANPRNLPELWFDPTYPFANTPRLHNEGPNKPPDERTVKLGKTLRILQERLPTLLQSPLPQEILAPNITLHLFPSTHPHLPTVTGRVAYIAALWSSPIAWNRIPIIGDVKLEILSERMVKQPVNPSDPRPGAKGEQLVVRWRTTGKGIGWRLPFKEIVPMAKSKVFTGLFIFDFDKDGKVLSHTIENVQTGGDWEKGVGAKVVGLTDWLLGGMRGGRESCPAFIQRDSETPRRSR